MDILTRFYESVPINKSPTECWDWLGQRNRKGYGCIWYDGGKKTAHRVSYIIHHGPIPESLCVLHSCDNPSCVNPNHLSVGTFKQNSEDMVKKGRSRRGEIHPNAIISNKTVIDIRVDYFAGIKRSDILGKYKIPIHSFKNIITKNYRHFLYGVNGCPTYADMSRARGCLTKGTAKLTAAQVREIRQKLSIGMTYASIAKEYGVSIAPISDIKRGIAHRHV